MVQKVRGHLTAKNAKPSSNTRTVGFLRQSPRVRRHLGLREELHVFSRVQPFPSPYPTSPQPSLGHTRWSLDNRRHARHRFSMQASPPLVCFVQQ